MFGEIMSFSGPINFIMNMYGEMSGVVKAIA